MNIYMHVYIYIYNIYMDAYVSVYQLECSRTAATAHPQLPNPHPTPHTPQRDETSCFQPTQGSSWGYLKVNSSETLSIFADKCPQNGSKNEQRAPRTSMGCPHQGPSVDQHLSSNCHPGGSPRMNQWFLNLTPIQTLPEWNLWETDSKFSLGICGKLT